MFILLNFSKKSSAFFLKLLLIILTITLLVCASACSNNNSDNTHRLQWWLNAINWDVQNRTNGLSGKGVVIAVIDTAIDESHPDLKDKIIEQYIVDGGYGDLQYEHGTAVVGIICASPNNEDGVLRIAVDAKIISVVISNHTEAQLGALVEGIEYAITKNVDIINISAGIIENNPKLQSAINKAYSAGIVIVAASGNDLYGTKMYPASYDNVISVDSIDSNGRKLYGQDSNSVFLPGGNIVTTYSSSYDPKKYVSYSGTSMSAPMLTGVIALILEQNPSLTSQEITSYFLNHQTTEFDTVQILKDFK